MQGVLIQLTKIAAERRIPMLLIGGHALQAYGVTRQTLDVDVLIAEAHAAAMEEALLQVGYTVQARSEIFARHRHASPLLPDVDVLFVDDRTAERMSRQATERLMGGAACRVPALPHLLALKLHAIRNNPPREPRDFADIVELLRANPGAISPDALRALCAQYGPEGIWEKLEAAPWTRG